MSFIGENFNVVLAITGLFFAAAGTIVEKLAPPHRRITRSILVVIAVVGFLITAYASWLQESANRKVEAQIGQLIDPNGGVLSDVAAKLARIDAEVRTIAPAHTAQTPEAPAPPKDEYFVQIEASSSAESLESDMRRIQKTYNLSSDFVGIVNIPGPFPYKLAFGQHLDKLTAEKYASVANNLNLAPQGQSAYVRVQPK
jgi:hypothetical protein